MLLPPVFHTFPFVRERVLGLRSDLWHGFIVSIPTSHFLVKHREGRDSRLIPYAPFGNLVEHTPESIGKCALYINRRTNYGLDRRQGWIVSEDSNYISLCPADFPFRI